MGIVIPTAGTERRVRAEVVPLVVNCVRSIVERSSYENYELICVFDSSTDPDTLRALETIAGEHLRLVEYGEAFNFSRKINLGVVESDSEYLLLLNDDTEVVTPDWIETLVAFATSTASEPSAHCSDSVTAASNTPASCSIAATPAIRTTAIRETIPGTARASGSPRTAPS